jgi:hypothetical protein
MATRPQAPPRLPGGARCIVASFFTRHAPALRVLWSRRQRTPHASHLLELDPEDARTVLLQNLAAVWPHILKKLDAGAIGEDSGSCTLSRFPSNRK